jgi:two-component system chemotaxis sensor kinase CheA
MTELESELLQKLLTTFRDEAADHLQTINQSLLKMERIDDENERQTLVQEAFRAAHSLKGAARAVSLTDIEELAHDIESILQTARHGDAPLGADTCDVLYNALDTIEQLVAGERVDTDSLRSNLKNAKQQNGDVPDQPTVNTVIETKAPNNNMAPGEETIRVSLHKLDDLMAQVGELLVSKISAEQRLVETRNIDYQLAQWPKMWREISLLLPHIEGRHGRPLAETLHRHAEYMHNLVDSFSSLNQTITHDTLQLGMVTTDLQDKVRRVRMVPFQTLTPALERTVRDVARSENKQVTFSVTGGEVELDKQILESLKDPLIHLLRNAVDHGIESPDRREKAGKSPEGLIELIIQQRGSEVRIAVSDDGQGFDLEALLKSYRANDNAALSADASEDEIIALAFLPGMTTSQQVTAISGRGVGLDVVRQRIEAVQGRIAVENMPGHGAVVRLVVPTTLAMMRGLMVRAGNERYALPLLSVEKIIEPHDSYMVSGKRMITVDETPLPLAALSAVLERPETDAAPSPNPLAIVLNVADQRLALLVDDVLTEQELAVKPLGKPLQRVRNVTGAALLGNGEPVIILNPADLVKSARGTRAPIIMFPSQKDKDQEETVHRILVVDDSITTRTLEKNILEAAGYEVITATDGTEALKRLKEGAIDLVVADIQMPQMDGISLTTHLRGSETYRGLPIILVTSLESREDRERGMMAGADAYIIKRGFDQAELLTTIQRLL